MRWGAFGLCLFAAGPVFADAGLLDGRGRVMLDERLLELFAEAPSRPADFDVENWRIENPQQVDARSDMPATPLAEDVSGLTPAEAQAFRTAVSACWLVTDAVRTAQVSVVVAFSLTPDGLVENGDVILQSVSTDNEDLRNEAFLSAQRAVLRCQGDGYALPAEKYVFWRDIELAFDAAQVSTR